MSAAGVAEAIVKAANDNAFDVVIANFANADMVGHSGKMEPTIKAIEAVDACLGESKKLCAPTAEPCSSPPITATPK